MRVTVLVLLLWVAGCGSDDGTVATSEGTAPSVSTVLSGTTKVEKTGTKLAISSVVKVTFSKAMDTASVTASTLKIEADGKAVAGAISVDSTDQAFTFTPTANLAPLTEHTLTIVGGASGVKDATGNTMSGSAVYTFTTGCASNDAFDKDSSSCYTWRNTSNQTNASGATTSAAKITINNGSDGVLKLAFTSAETNLSSTTSNTKVPMLYRSVSGDFDVRVTVKTYTISDQEPTAAGLYVGESFDTLPTYSLICKFVDDGCISTQSLSGVFSSGTADACGIGDGPHNNANVNTILRIVRSGTTLRCYYKIPGNADFTQVGSDFTVSGMATNLKLAIFGESRSDAGDGVITFDDLTFNSGATSD